MKEIEVALQKYWQGDRKEEYAKRRSDTETKKFERL